MPIHFPIQSPITQCIKTIPKEEIHGWVKLVPETEEEADAEEEDFEVKEDEEVEEIIILAKNAEAGPVEAGEKRDHIRPQDLRQHQVDLHYQLRLRLLHRVYHRHPHRLAFLEKPLLAKSHIWD